MSIYNAHKVTAIPATYAANDLFFMAPADQPTDLEVYLADSAGASLRKIFSRSDTTAAINTAIEALNNGSVADNIAARNSIAAPKDAQQVLVIDATADDTVDAGAATYVYRAATAEWVKISEAESLDLEITWAALTGKPNSTPALIDAAVAAAHSHPNMTQLGNIGQDGEGNMTYNGDVVATVWATENW